MDDLRRCGNGDIFISLSLCRLSINLSLPLLTIILSLFPTSLPIFSLSFHFPSVPYFFPYFLLSFSPYHPRSPFLSPYHSLILSLSLSVFSLSISFFPSLLNAVVLLVYQAIHMYRWIYNNSSCIIWFYSHPGTLHSIVMLRFVKTTTQHFYIYILFKAIQNISF